MKIFKKIYVRFTPSLLLILGLSGFVSPVQASFDSDFVHKYTELNLGNWGHRYYTFPDSKDQINAFNRSVSINIPIGQSYKVNADFSTRMMLRYGSNFWQWSDNNGVVSARPRANFYNAGIGFNLGFGRLIEPANNPYGLWIYESAAGKITRFYDNFSGETPVANVFYSHDSEKLRLKKLSSTRMTLEFTNGHVHEFREQEGSWEIYKRSDQFGNYQQFTYNYTSNQVTTSDNHGRVQWIHFKADPSGYFPRVIDKIRVTKFGGGVAYHTFNYSTLTLSAPAEDNDGATPGSIVVPVLTSITHPGSELSSFSYFGNGDIGRGRLSNYWNRFGGKIKYTYASINLPLVQNPANLNQTLDHFAADGIGVTSRQATDVGGAILGNWTFSNRWHGGSGVRNAAPSLSQPTAMVTEMVSPDGVADARYFRAIIKDVALTSPQVYTVDKSEYGYPGLVNDWKEALESAISHSGSKASTRGFPVYSCTNCLDPNPRYANYIENDVGGFNKRNIYSTLNWAGGAGNVQQRDNWTIKRITGYVRETYKPSTSSLWIAKPATKTTITEGTYTKITESCVNSLGQITRQRQLRGTVAGSNDFIQAFTYDASGNRTQISYFGGDSQAVGTGSLCSLGLPAAQTRKYTNYSKGVVSGEGYLTSSGSIAYEKSSMTIDPSTGLASSYSKGDGLFVNNTYDNNYRLINRAYPAGQGGQVSVAFTAGSATANATRTNTQKTNNGASTLGQTIKKYDGFGRVIETKKLGPTGWKVTSSTYDAMGYMSTSTNERGGVSQYLNRDYKGRVGIKRPPEGASHDITYTYSGDKTSTRKVSIAKDLTTNPPVELFRTTTTTYDLFGRAIVRSISDQDGFVTTRTTSFNLNNNWVSKTEGSSTLSNLNQYDALGFLTVDSYGSSHTYNALGKPLEEYSAYGDKIDFSYDSAGRLLGKNVQGVQYTSYVYATINNAGEYNKGKLVSATRYNPNHLDIGDTVSVTDSYEYKGKGGKLSKRSSSIDTPGSNFATSESTVVYNDALQPLTLTSPSCISSAKVNCSLNSPSMLLNYGYNLGHLVSVTGDGESLLSNVQYNASGDVTSYHNGNGLDTMLYYSADVNEPNQVKVLQGSVVQWDSGLAVADGDEIVNHYGNYQEIPDDFYDTPTLQAQPTTYLSKWDNTALEDGLGMVVYDDARCKGTDVDNAGCKNVYLYNSRNQVVWKRHRPNRNYQWSIGVVATSELTFPDVLGRSGSKLIGDVGYNYSNYQLDYDKTYNQSYSELNIYAGGSRTLLAKKAAVSSSSDMNYTHPNFFLSYVGESIESGIFTANENF